MTKNTSRTFATMSEDQRRNFALEKDAESRELPTQLDFDEPRDLGHMGSQFATEGGCGWPRGRRTGAESQSWLSPSWLTRLGDRAAYEYNQT